MIQSVNLKHEIIRLLIKTPNSHLQNKKMNFGVAYGFIAKSER